MAKSSFKNVKTIWLELTEEEAKFLRNKLQNPHSSFEIVGEPKELREHRKSIFEALINALK